MAYEIRFYERFDVGQDILYGDFDVEVLPVIGKEMTEKGFEGFTPVEVIERDGWWDVIVRDN